MKPSSRMTSALRVTLLYLLFGGLWIALSDQVLDALVRTPSAYQQWQTYKGWAFVAASGAVIYFLVTRETRLRRLRERLFSDVLNLLPDPVVIRRIGDDAYAEANRAFADLLDTSPDEVVGKTPEELGVQLDPAEWEAYSDLLEHEGRVENFTLHVGFPDGAERTLLATASVEEYGGERYVVSVDKEITELERTRERLRSQIRRIQSLRDIDRAITGSLDIRVTFNVVLDQVTEQLGVDAAGVLLLNDVTRTLEFGASRGFRTQALKHTTLGLGEGFAGRAAEEQELVWVDDLGREPGRFTRSDHLEEEGFVSYGAVPLVAKGKVNGVLELFHRSRLEPTQDWFDFLETLAGQASIAVDTAEMYQDLQRSHDRLREAYDDTIEGWARALDLRDRETYGHTQRVARVTVELAERMGVPEDQLIHLRRGALLHDIGKMGVPDAILLKPGSLNEAEWQLMRRHPELAHRLLSPIEFLQPALDIPHYHHEKWDGTGYPDGLREREIPLAARIFAVVDVWDALLSDRPYRDPWPEDRVFEHLREESGSHFAPAVVEAFLELDLKRIPILERTGPEDLTRPGLTS